MTHFAVQRGTADGVRAALIAMKPGLVPASCISVADLDSMRLLSHPAATEFSDSGNYFALI